MSAMVHKYYRLGGLTFGVRSEYPILDSSVFACEASAPDYEIIIKAENSFTPDRTAQGCARTKRLDRTIYLTMKEAQAKALSVFSLFNAFDLPGLLLENACFVLHASYILHDGEAILFTGASGIGKSTQAELWRQTRGANIVNGDRALVGLSDGKAAAHGYINCGSSGICQNISAPIRAVVILGRSTENTVWKPGGIEAFKALVGQCAYNVTSRRQVEEIINLLAEMIPQVKILRLDCTNTPSAVECLERAL